MSKRIKYFIVAAGVAAVCICAAATTAYNGDFKLGQNVELVVNMMRGIFLYYVDPVDADVLGKNAAAGMVKTLDPYTELIHADDAREFELMTTGKYGGIGSIIRQKGEYVQIAEPYRGSPADRAGLEIGDTFLEIEGKNARGMTTSDVSSALKGEAGTVVTIKVRKFYTGQEQTITIRREVISMPSVPYFGMVTDSVGYIHHAEFTDGSANDLRSAFTNLKAHGAKSLVLDYRSNGGGIMQEAVKILAMFVPKGTEVVNMRGRSEGSNKQYFTETEPLDTEIPIAVLVNGYSASASEIVAGALQDLDRAVVIGERTFGKGLVQSTLPLGFDSFLKITTAKYYIPSGRCIQAIDYSSRSESGGVGVVPDSLIREFRTAGGRRVYDGGGIMPDVRLEPEYSSNFAYVAYGKGYIDEFVDKWMLDNREREVVPGEFAFTDADYAGFAEFMKDKDLNYESLTEQSLSSLRRSAELERVMTDEMRGAIDSLEAMLKNDNSSDLDRYRDELEGIIEEGIVLRRHARQGVSQHNIVDDNAVAEAVKMLHGKARYLEILKEKDTDRK
jgi:carboxyl-terminal processing protease